MTFSDLRLHTTTLNNIQKFNKIVNRNGWYFYAENYKSIGVSLIKDFSI